MQVRFALLAAACRCGTAEAQTYEPVADWLKVPAGRETLGPMHGDIAVSRAGEVYVSVETPGSYTLAGLRNFAPVVNASAFAVSDATNIVTAIGSNVSSK